MHLGNALRAFARSLRARRRLAKLAPHEFDPFIMRREQERREKDRIHDEKCAAALDAVYGPGAGAEMHRVRERQEQWLRGRVSRPTRRAVERWKAERELWLQAGVESLDLFEAHAPHRLLSLQRIAQLLDIASQLGRSACNMPQAHDKEPKIDPCELEHRLTFEEQLEKIYGDKAWAERESASSASQ
jgi:hypothetical protein